MKPNCWASFFSAHFRAHNLGTNSGPHGCAEHEMFDPSALNSKRFRYHIEPHADLGSCVLLHQVTLYEVMIGRHAFYFDSCGEKAARDHIEPHANSCFCRLPQETLYEVSLRRHYVLLSWCYVFKSWSSVVGEMRSDFLCRQSSIKIHFLTSR